MPMESRSYDIRTLPLVLTAEELVQILGLKRHLVYALLRLGQIKSLRIGTAFRIPRQALEAYMASVVHDHTESKQIGGTLHATVQ